MKTWTRVKTKEQFDCVATSNVFFADCIIVDFEIAADEKVLQKAEALRKENRKVYYQLPDVLRQPDVEKYFRISSAYDGLVIKNLDELGMVVSSGQRNQNYEFIGDAFLYMYNEPAYKMYRRFLPNMKFILSDELNKEELEQLISGKPSEDFILKVYGYQPLMITAQCLNKNYERCRKQQNARKEQGINESGNKTQNPVIRFKDETGEEFYSVSNCRECCSVIYKGEPTCILSKAEEKYENLLFDFTLENGEETDQILRNREKMAYKPGHYHKGIE